LIPVNEITPNYSCRMDNLRAAILRPQLHILDQQCARWNNLYGILEDRLNCMNSRHQVLSPAPEGRLCGELDSIQLTDIFGRTDSAVSGRLRGTRGTYQMVRQCQAGRIYQCLSQLEIFQKMPAMHQTNAVLARMCDMRIPLTFEAADCHLISDIIAEEIYRL
jgi:dTDP-4-amino-4,6-dideoxygalactose transaminase